MIGESLIDISAINSEPTPDTDWLFFYSRNGVKHFFKQCEDYVLQLILDKAIKIGAFGKATAQALHDIEIATDFVGDGNPPEVAADFLAIAQGQTVVFVQGSKSRASVEQALTKQINSHSLIVYRNTPNRNIAIPAHQIAVFTSPMNAETYFFNKLIHAPRHIVAIGSTTKERLQQLGIKRIFVPNEPSELALAKLIVAKFG